MRYAVIADIHANLEALEAVLKATESLDIDRLVCLGDIVGYYANPNECVELVRRHATACIRGNHDSVAAGLREPMEFSPLARHAIAWTSEHLTVRNRVFLEDLPLLQDVDDAFLIVHAALHPVPNDAERIRNAEEARPSLEILAGGYAGQHVCFVGHMHEPAVYTMHGDEIEQRDGNELCMDAGVAYLINPGSVGQSRSADPRASFLIYDSARRTVQFYRVSYDYAAAKERAIGFGLMPRPHLVRRSLSWIKRRLLAPHPGHEPIAGTRRDHPPTEHARSQVDRTPR